MLLLSISQTKKLNCVLLLILAFTLIGNVRTIETNETSKIEAVNKIPAVVTEQKSVKKELKVNITDEAIEQITPPSEKDDHTEKLVIIDEKSIIETSGKALEQETGQKASEKIGVVETATTKSEPKEQQHYKQPVDEEFVLSDADDISESLKTGFYFFLILSLGAIVFIIFKIYRLRLSRAERKYGVQGDRSTQELTPLPISIEDGHSDDEDQTLFEVQRQNIRIL
ncbi:uncharacterized protein LOC135960124 [Calliphora vicina]|uniref:uncharacterized protein LOC135960124 n=1 Tax=Calliphora vicina TaxID=7373 RepID=UPI00325A47F5